MIFEEALLHMVAPRLKACGYEFDERLREGDELYGFRKSLGGDVHAIVQFQRHRAATHDSFTINLLRVKTEAIQPRVYGGYAGSLGARLSHVWWFVHLARTDPPPNYWWPADEANPLEASLSDALNKFEQYGRAWIEDARSKKPWEMPAHRGQEFTAAVKEIVEPEMTRSGFRLESKSLAGNIAYLYFTKSMPDGTSAFVEMQLTYSLYPDEFAFDVQLQRKPTGDPFDLGGDDPRWRAAALSQLAWRSRKGQAIETISPEEAKRLLWHYTDRAELIERLRDASDQIKRIGMAWLEATGSDTIIDE